MVHMMNWSLFKTLAGNQLTSLVIIISSIGILNDTQHKVLVRGNHDLMLLGANTQEGEIILVVVGRMEGG